MEWHKYGAYVSMCLDVSCSNSGVDIRQQVARCVSTMPRNKMPSESVHDVLLECMGSVWRSCAHDRWR